MSLSVTVTRRGLNLKLLADHFSSDVVEKLVAATAEFAFNQMYSNAPWHTGNLAMSIKTTVDGAQASIKPLAAHTVYVVKGTRPHIIRPKNASVLAFEGSTVGGLIFTRLVHHPGTKPNPFIHTSAVETQDESLKIAKAVLDDVLGRTQE
jgi:hypothetical protein